MSGVPSPHSILGVSRRQAELIDWLKHPTDQPDHSAIRPAEAWWTAAQIVEGSGLYENRRACLADLNDLARRLIVTKTGNLWRYLWLP